ncbi:MAG: Gfo/Idh/MocA family oxidoreductase [Rhodothermales bacterium]|nr:Gfo/Idh/MocA family oxidoreductase [Rhodothermales bacterium]
MNVGIIGNGEVAARRRAVAAVRGVRLRPVPVAGAGEALDGLDVVFVAGPTADHYRLAEAAAKRGVHVFLDWPPATSVRECEAMGTLAEEAGVEVGVSRPLRFHPVFGEVPAAWRASLILLRRTYPPEAPAAWPRWLADAADLCCALAQSHSVQRIDAEAARVAAPWPSAVGVGLRFHNGAYAQVSLRHGGAAAPRGTLYAAGGGTEVEAALEEAVASEGEANAGEPPAFDPADALRASETAAFLRALREGRPAPVSILDGLHTLRLVERLMTRLR